MFCVFDSVHVYVIVLKCKYDDDKVSAKKAAAVPLHHPERRSTVTSPSLYSQCSPCRDSTRWTSLDIRCSESIQVCACADLSSCVRYTSRCAEQRSVSKIIKHMVTLCVHVHHWRFIDSSTHRAACLCVGAEPVDAWLIHRSCCFLGCCWNQHAFKLWHRGIIRGISKLKPEKWAMSCKVEEPTGLHLDKTVGTLRLKK